jgi:hypothetical protein
MPASAATIGPPSLPDVVRRVVDWCDRAPDGRIRVGCAHHGLVCSIDVSRMPRHLADDRVEDTRRFFLAMVAHHATFVESRLDDAPATARNGDPTAPTLADLEDTWTWPGTALVLIPGSAPIRSRSARSHGGVRIQDGCESIAGCLARSQRSMSLAMLECSACFGTQPSSNATSDGRATGITRRTSRSMRAGTASRGSSPWVAEARTTC